MYSINIVTDHVLSVLILHIWSDDTFLHIIINKGHGLRYTGLASITLSVALKCFESRIQVQVGVKVPSINV